MPSSYADVRSNLMTSSCQASFDVEPTYFEADIAGTAQFPSGISFVIAQYASLFGTETGRALQHWCLKWGWLVNSFKCSWCQHHHEAVREALRWGAPRTAAITAITTITPAESSSREGSSPAFINVCRRALYSKKTKQRCIEVKSYTHDA